MGRLFISLIALLCVGCSLQERRFEEAVVRTIQPGDNVTLHCDVKNELRTIWYRQCSHENQPPREISSQEIMRNPVPRYSFVWNDSSHSFGLWIENITESDLGLYYCSAQFTKIETRNKFVYSEDIYNFGNVTTRLQFPVDSLSSTAKPNDCLPATVQNWILMAGVPAACVLLSIPLCVFTYWLGKTKGLKQFKVKERNTRTIPHGNREQGEAEHLNYITLQYRKEHRRCKTMTGHSDEVVTYSEIH
ncbi:uncharacterized protein LOC111853144 isoform X1 [Arapaima gigas]